MTEINLPTHVGPPEVMPAYTEGDAVASRSFWHQVALDVFARRTAQLGALWIGLLAFCAVFAPLLCNSHPLLLKQGGRWSSPMMRYLTGADAALLILTAITLVLLFFRTISAKVRTLTWIAVVVAASIICPLTIHPPENVIYEKYRVAQAQGAIERAVYAPVAFSPDDHQRDQEEARLKPPTRQHLFGTTSDSADLLANLVHASRVALSIGFISTGIAVVIGILVGGVMGYFGGAIDLIGMRVVEVIDAIPTLLLLLIFVAVFSPNLYIMMAIIGLTSWVQYAYFIRAEFLSLRDRDFVQAARAAGLPLRRILFRHMLPNGVTPLIVSASFGVASAILVESTLSFLGIGLHTEASWGNLLEQALGDGGTFYWWIALYPGLAIFLTVFAYNLIGESLRDALDPKLRQT